MTEAEIAHSNGLPFRYGEHKLSDGDTLNVGSLKINVLYTPGHTNESVCYVVYKGAEPILIFSGDTLFAGSVGRSDLYGKAAQPPQAEKLYRSLQEKLLPLGDSVSVYPAHGTGSVCGHGISGQEPTTIGYEKKNNPYLQLGREEFIKKQLGEELFLPRYFKKMEEYNLNGPPLLSELAYPKSMSLPEFEEEAQNPLVLTVDTRLPYAFAGSHIPNSLSIWLGGTSVYPGWLLDTKQYIVFVYERPIDRRAAHLVLRAALAHLGQVVDHPVQQRQEGFLDGQGRAGRVRGRRRRGRRARARTSRPPERPAPFRVINSSRPGFLGHLQLPTGEDPERAEARGAGQALEGQQHRVAEVAPQPVYLAFRLEHRRPAGLPPARAFRARAV